MDAAHASARTWVGQLTGRSGADLDRTMAEGAAYAATADDELSKAAVAARRQRGRLTPRQTEALALRASGLTVAQTAARMGVSVNTAKYHLKVGRRVIYTEQTNPT